MKRRDLMSDLGGYSLVVLAGSSASAGAQRPAGIAKPDFDTVAPLKKPKGTPQEPNLALVNLETDLLVDAGAVRIHVTATNGDDFARIFEVRCYA